MTPSRRPLRPPTPRPSQAWLCAAVAVTLLAPAALHAQGAGGSQGGGADEVLVVAPASTTSDAGFSFFGRRPDRRRLIPGFWRTHPYDRKWPDLTWTRGVAATAGTFFAGALMNSYDDFSMTAGVERQWLVHRGTLVDYGLGYRAGFITGYDEQLISWADDVPAVPFLGVQLFLQVGRMGFDAFYVYRVITLETSIGF